MANERDNNRSMDQDRSSSERSNNTNKGNFKNDPERASREGSKGGKAKRSR